MINKPVLNILSIIALLGPVAGTAACLDSDAPAIHMTSNDCHGQAQYLLADLSREKASMPADSQKAGDPSKLSALDVTEMSNVSPKGPAKHSPKGIEPTPDHFNWMPKDWFEAY